MDDIYFSRLVEKHLRTNAGFALYRLPGCNVPVLAIQRSVNLAVANAIEHLQCSRGFVMSPFSAADNLPTVAIRPDVFAQGWDEVEQTLAALDAQPENAQPEALPLCDMPRQQYMEALDAFKAHLSHGDANKLVLARSATRNADVPLGKLFAEACRKYPFLMVYLCYTPLTGAWFGCSPEILVEGSRSQWRTVALAGTQPYADNAQWDAKNMSEQGIVEDYIRAKLSAAGAYYEVEGPYSARAGHLMHLRTDVRFSAPDDMSAAQVAALLHPTPAVCGLPQSEAQRIIEQCEPTRRLYYSGIVGWIDNEAQSHLYVNLRCLMAHGGQITTFAGGGIMPQSVPDAEWNETEMKMDTLLNII